MNMELVIDNASIEMFADDGLSVMTAIFFPGKEYSDIRIASPAGFRISSLEFNKMKTAMKNGAQ
jgi:fructan beta-fructosidase